jgi:hypothetical protein
MRHDAAVGGPDLLSAQQNGIGVVAGGAILQF